MVLTLVLGALAAASGAYYWAATAATAGFRRRPPPGSCSLASLPGVSLLKPTTDPDPGFLDLLRSHAAQDHPEFEIIVGLRPGDRETAAAVRRIRALFPGLRILGVECPSGSGGLNDKVQALERLAEHASKPVLVVNDADVRVPQGYLRTICRELGAAGTGLVTCLYRGEAEGGLAARLEALRINTEFPAQVSLARRLQGMRFGLGATLAFRRETIERLGGFRSLREFVGDDYLLGARIAASGLRVEVSSVPVVTRTGPNDGPRRVWDRQLRWSRTIRKQRPAGHAGLAVSFATVWCGLALLAQPASLWPIAALALAARLAAAVASTRIVGSSEAVRSLWLVPLADVAAFAVWVFSYFGNEVQWAGRRIRLGAGGRILP